MKQFFLSFALIATVAIAAAARPVPTEDPLVEKAFRQLFTGASNVSWSKEEGKILRASFLWGEHHTIAYFGNDGELLGSVRNLFFSQLPLTVIRSFNEDFKGHVVLEIREISNDEGTSYSLLTEHKNKNYKLRLNSQGSLITKERVKK